MLTVALTGGIATGKTVVAGVLRRRGCHVAAADSAAHAVMEPEKPAWKRILAHFGADILNSDKTINRAKLGDIIFRDAGARKFVDGIVHPLVLALMRSEIARLAKDGRTKIYVSEAALTIEAGYTEFFDKIVVTYCPEEEQLRRLRARDRISREAAQLKIGAQMPSERKLAYADYIIDTGGAVEETIAQAEEIYEELLLDFRIKYGAADTPG
jgi:dephospho-CoA kinase